MGSYLPLFDFVETGPHSIGQVGLEFSMYSRLALSLQWSSSWPPKCLILGMSHLTGPSEFLNVSLLSTPHFQSLQNIHSALSFAKKKKNQASAMPTLFRKFQYFLKCQRKLGKGDFTKRKLTSNLRMGFWMKSLILFLSHWKEKPCSFSTGKWWAGICPQSSSNIILTSSDMAKPQIARVEPRPDPRPLIPTQCFAAAFLTLNKNSISLFNKHNTIVRTKWLKKKIPVSLNLCLLESTLPHTSPQTRLDSSFLVQSCFLHHSSYASNISYLLVYMWVHPLVL